MKALEVLVGGWDFNRHYGVAVTVLDVGFSISCTYDRWLVVSLYSLWGRGYGWARSWSFIRRSLG